MPPPTYNRVIPPSLVDRFTTLEAKIARLEEQVAVQAATIRALTVHDDSVCERAFGASE